MRIDFRPQRLLNSLVFEEKVPQGIRRIMNLDREKRKTIDMIISKAPNSYPKEYYVSSYKVYDKTGLVSKELNRDNNGIINITTKNYDGTYSSKMVK